MTRHRQNIVVSGVTTRSQQHRYMLSMHARLVFITVLNPPKPSLPWIIAALRPIHNLLAQPNINSISSSGLELYYERYCSINTQTGGLAVD